MNVPRNPSRLNRYTLLAAAATAGIGLYHAISLTNEYLRDQEYIAQAASTVIPAAPVIIEHIHTGEAVFMRGLADAHDDMKSLPRGHWEQIDYGTDIQAFEKVYEAGYDHQIEYGIDTEDLAETFTISNSLSRMSEMTVVNLMEEFASLENSPEAISANILQGIDDATHGAVMENSSLADMIATVSLTGNEKVDETLGRVRHSMTGLYQQFLAGDGELLADLAGDAMEEFSMAPVPAEMDDAPTPM